MVSVIYLLDIPWILRNDTGQILHLFVGVFSNLHTDFYIDWTSLHFTQQYLTFSFIHISNICCYYFLNN